MSFEKPWGNYLLEKLVETPAPETISFFPQTIGWQVLSLICVLWVVKKAHSAWKTYQNNAYRREALSWLEQCDLSNEKQLRQLPALLRKTAILANELSIKSANARKNTAELEAAQTRHDEIRQLSGLSWLTWLDKYSTHCQFSQQDSRAGHKVSNEKLLVSLAYAPSLPLADKEFSTALNTLRLQITLWVKHHDLSHNRIEQEQVNA